MLRKRHPAPHCTICKSCPVGVGARGYELSLDHDIRAITLLHKILLFISILIFIIILVLVRVLVLVLILILILILIFTLALAGLCLTSFFIVC